MLYPEAELGLTTKAETVILPFPQYFIVEQCDRTNTHRKIAQLVLRLDCRLEYKEKSRLTERE